MVRTRGRRGRDRFRLGSDVVSADGNGGIANATEGEQARFCSSHINIGISIGLVEGNAARQALDAAEESFDKDKDKPVTVDLAYVDQTRENLDASKKKLAEKTKANDDLQKLLSKTKNENAELQQKVKELEAKLAELEPVEEKAVAVPSLIVSDLRENKALHVTRRDMHLK